MPEPARSIPIAGAARDAALMALVALALAGPIIGLKTVPLSDGGLTLQSRWSFVVIAALVVFAGRFLLHLLLWRAHRPAARPAPAPARRALSSWLGKSLGAAILIAGLAWPLLPTTDRYLLDIGILVLTYVMLGWGLNIVVGLAGLLDLGYVAFYAVGAYSYALLAQHFGLSFWICLPIAGIMTAFWGVLLGFPVLRLRGDYLAIVTLAFGEIIRLVLVNWDEFTGGPNGISGIPRPSFFGLPFTNAEGGFAAAFGLEFSPLHRIVFLYYVILGLALITLLVTVRLRRLPIGMAWEALREDEIACRSLGINTRNTKLTAFALGAMFGGFAGSFFATRQGFISPESFVFMESALILAIVVLGGLGSQIGIVIAAVVMIGGIELLRDLTWLRGVFGPSFDPALYRMLLFGLAMVVVMVWKPRGLISTRIPSIALKRRKAIGAELVAQGRG
jgi:branched-chain amino acid transport system permease protein